MAERDAERRRREDDAPRLGQMVPGLLSLRLEIAEREGVAEVRYTRLVVVDRAPALFIIRCTEPRCHDGEHDLTASVMHALRAHLTSFDGDDDCNGSVGSMSTACGRVLHFDAVAAYAA